MHDGGRASGRASGGRGKARAFPRSREECANTCKVRHCNLQLHGMRTWPNWKRMPSSTCERTFHKPFAAKMVARAPAPAATTAMGLGAKQLAVGAPAPTARARGPTGSRAGHQLRLPGPGKGPTDTARAMGPAGSRGSSPRLPGPGKGPADYVENSDFADGSCLLSPPPFRPPVGGRNGAGVPPKKILCRPPWLLHHFAHGSLWAKSCRGLA
jgi:hypothetical protein